MTENTESTWETEELERIILNDPSEIYFTFRAKCKTVKQLKRLVYHMGLMSRAELSRVDFNEVFQTLNGD